jgi:EpsI family protein
MNPFDSRLRNTAILSVLLLSAWFVGARFQHIDVAPLESADVVTVLPECIGDWQGQEVFYCQNESCARSYLSGELESSRVCLRCGGPLNFVSLGEQTLLPADTVVVRKAYRKPQGGDAVVTIVISGNDQRSIHRPQQCLPAQGFDIMAIRAEPIAISGRSPLVVSLVTARKGLMRLDMAYWFLGGGHETHDHFRRLGWMAWDNVARGVRSRWAYISVQMPCRDGIDPSASLADFLRQLYPVIVRLRPQ